MRYIKKYNEGIEWEFDEEEIPELGIHNLANYKIYELYEIFFNKNPNNMIEWLNSNLKGKRINLIGDDDDDIFLENIFVDNFVFSIPKIIIDRYIKNKKNRDILVLNKKYFILLYDKIKIIE